MLTVERGTCHSIFVYDIAFSIDLNEAERRISSSTRETIKHKRRAPGYFEYRPAPLRISQNSARVPITENFSTNPVVELVVYDFGAVTVIYRIPLGGETPNLLSLSASLYENQQLLSDSRTRVEELLKLIEPAVSKANIASFVEDYVIFHVEALAGPFAVEDLTTQ